MKINRSNNNTPIESVEVNTQDQAEQPRPTTPGIASSRDSFETAPQKDNGLFSNVNRGSLIGSVVVGAIDHSLNTKGNNLENYDFPGSSSQMKTNNANDEALEGAEKQRELLEKQKEEITPEQPITAVVAAAVQIVGNLISNGLEDQAAAKEKEPSASDEPVRRDDD